jgi:predicted GNAT family acetyltransferase
VTAAEGEVRDNPEASRYELVLDGRVAGRLDYRLSGGTVSLNHAEVDQPLRGQGLGDVLAAGALADAAERGLKVVPRCPFVAAYVRRHPELADLLA